MMEYPVAHLNFRDAMMLAPVLSSYGAWIRQVCPSPSVIREKMAAIDSIQAKLVAIQKERPPVIDAVIFQVTEAEVDVIIHSLEYFVASIAKTVTPSRQRDEI